MKFRKKPLIVDAFCWDGEDSGNFPKWALDSWDIILDVPIGLLTINTLEGEVNASPGDWIIKGIKGEIYPCKPDIFEATYEEVEE